MKVGLQHWTPIEPQSCTVSPQFQINGIVEPQQEWASVDDGGELCGECAPEAHDGDEVTDDENVETSMRMPCPKLPTAAEKALHDLTNMPYRSWCLWCVAGRRNNSHHRPQNNKQNENSHCALPLPRLLFPQG